ncbi:MAG TPA: GNAT family protein [Phycisphaerales bacterium]|nr:GNAT family protein [Phycisphaerales bacterium]
MGIELRTPRLLLRPLFASDRAAWTEMMLAAEESFVRSGMTVDRDATLDQRFDQALDKTTRALETETGYRFQAFVAPDQPCAGLMIGGAALNNVVRGVFQNADMGWGIRGDREGMGYATEMCTALLDFAFAHPPAGLGLHRVQVNVRPDNDRSLKLAARLGFRREGYAAKMLHIMGDWRDHVMFAKLAEEHPVGPGGVR